MNERKESNPKDAIGTRKAPVSAVPAQVIAELGVAMLEGALKYGRYNYRIAGVRASVYYDALRRHLDAWWDCGENIDPDSGLSHVTKAMACLTVMRDAMLNDKFIDDRPPSAKSFYDELNKKAAALIDKYGVVPGVTQYIIADTQRAPSECVCYPDDADAGKRQCNECPK